MGRMARAATTWASGLSCCFLVLFVLALSAGPVAGATTRAKPEPKKCTIIQAAKWGLGSTLVTMMHFLAISPNETVYFDFTPSPYQCPPITTNMGKPITGWQLFFSGSLPRVWAGPSQSCEERLNSMRVARRDKKLLRYFEKKYKLSTEHVVGMTLPTDAEQRARRSRAYTEYMDLMCPIVKQMWKFSHTMQPVLAYDLGNIRLLPHPIIAVHVRGGDKLAAKEVPDGFPGYDWNSTFEKLGSVVGEEKGTCVFVGDDSKEASKAVAAAEAFMGCSIMNRVPATHQHHQGNFNSESAQARCYRTQKFLVELELLASANYSVGSVHSNVNTIAHLVKICVHGRKEETYMDLNSDDGHQIIAPRL